jgi:hypothetical protein
MRKAQAFLGLALLVGAAGCPPEGGRFNLLRPAGINPLPAEVPAREDLVAYLNNNSSNIPGIQSDDVGLTCYSGGPVGIPVSAKLRAQGPRNFRMVAYAIGSQEVDLGSNDQEFWYWIRKGDKYQVFCSYQALEEGKVKQMPFPFQPDWVLEAMGMGKYGPAEKYELVVEKEQLKLIEKTRSAQGQPVKKIIVFNRRKASGDQPQITDFLLVDQTTNKLICSAHITRRQIIPNRGEIPRELELRWPEQNMKLVLHLNGVQVSQQFPPQVFARTQLKGVPSYDLATGRVEGMQQAGGPKGPAMQR